MIHSHNSYWNRYGYIDARENDADIIEIDVIYHKGEVMCSHSWRPWKWLMYGKADNYFQAFKNYKGKEKRYLYIELKTDEYKIVAKLKHLIDRNANDNVMFIIGGKKGTDREVIADKIYNRTMIYSDIVRAEDFFGEHKDEIEKIRLYKNKPWYRRLNHF